MSKQISIASQVKLQCLEPSNATCLSSNINEKLICDVCHRKLDKKFGLSRKIKINKECKKP